MNGVTLVFLGYEIPAPEKVFLTLELGLECIIEGGQQKRGPEREGS